ncbi:ATP-dependent DNA helicase Q-like SIM [Acorus calamus]|uniref:ATP-dependent DNA helicase Q-like SIM n=1 Tax=Acorus calamus TaxID=4465 RepID=A0AAV9F5C4_ACOCL|nr:ATP-dependent DNA helicase Q-like SIM [Acorus calamus]
MLSDCFRYGMSTASCRAKTLVKYFGEEFSSDRCLICDICVTGLPELQNLKDDATIFLQALATLNTRYRNPFDDGTIYSEDRSGKLKEKANLRSVISEIRLQSQKFAATDQLWWRGVARILEAKGYICEGDDMVRVCIKYPEPTELGLKFLQSETEDPFYAYAEADMLLSMKKCKSFSSFSDWKRGWADPEIRRQRLQRKQFRTKKRKRHSGRQRRDLSTARGRIAAKISKLKQ